MFFSHFGLYAVKSIYNTCGGFVVHKANNFAAGFPLCEYKQGFRCPFFALYAIHFPITKMADELGVHISTIYRELKRGRYERLNSDYTTEERYSPDIAEQKYQENLRAKGAELKIGNDHEYAAYLEYKVSVDKYAPGAILGEIKRKGIVFNTSISKTTFYRYIEDGVFLTITNKDLPVKRNKNKQKYNHVKPSRAPKGKSIEKRPEEIETRETLPYRIPHCLYIPWC